MFCGLIFTDQRVPPTVTMLDDDILRVQFLRLGANPQKQWKLNPLKISSYMVIVSA